MACRATGRLEAPPRVFFSFIEKKGRTLGLFSTTSFSLFCIKEKGGEERAALKAAQAPSFLLYLLFLSIKKKKKEEKRGAALGLAYKIRNQEPEGACGILSLCPRERSCRRVFSFFFW